MKDDVIRVSKNLQCLKQPQRGDYWHEMMCAVAAVVRVSSHTVTVLRDRRVDDDGQVFTKSVQMSRKAFEEWLSYKTIPGTWADVMPNVLEKPEAYLEKEKPPTAEAEGG